MKAARNKAKTLWIGWRAGHKFYWSLESIKVAWMLLASKEGFVHIKVEADIDFCEHNMMADAVKQWEFVNLGIYWSHVFLIP